MILQAKILKNVLSQALTGDTQLCALFTDFGVLLSQVHTNDLKFEKDRDTVALGVSSSRGTRVSNNTENSSIVYDNTRGSSVNNQDLQSPITQSSRIVDAISIASNSNLMDSIRGYVAIMATLYTRYDRVKQCVGASTEQEDSSPEQDYNDLIMLCVESEGLKTVVVPLYEYRILLSGTSKVPLGLLKAKALDLRKYLNMALSQNDS